MTNFPFSLTSKDRLLKFTVIISVIESDGTARKIDEKDVELSDNWKSNLDLRIVNTNSGQLFFALYRDDMESTNEHSKLIVDYLSRSNSFYNYRELPIVKHR